MTILPIPVGELETNCYLVYKQGGDAVLIDPGGEAERIVEAVRQKNATVRAVFLTHAHFDHMMAAEAVAKEYEAPVLVHEAEQEALADGMINLSALMGGRICHVQADRFLRDGEEVTVGEMAFRVLHTPGHTRGSCCYDLPDEGVLFAGDTLFFHSFGRTDFPGGSDCQMRASIQRLLDLEGDRVVYPGHGPATTLAQERLYNPYARG